MPVTPHLAGLAATVLPVLQQLFTGEELEGIDLQRGPDGAVQLVVTAVGEQSWHWLWQHGVDESPEGLAARVASELQDAVSESRFGWGHQRSGTAHPLG